MRIIIETDDTTPPTMATSPAAPLSALEANPAPGPAAVTGPSARAVTIHNGGAAPTDSSLTVDGAGPDALSAGPSNFGGVTTGAGNGHGSTVGPSVIDGGPAPAG